LFGLGGGVRGLGKWFLVQTNWDRDVPDPKKDRRRVPLERKIAERGFDRMSYEDGWGFIRERPNWIPFGPQASTITSVIIEMDYSEIYGRRELGLEVGDGKAPAFRIDAVRWVDDGL
jgi:hypothetical protein